MRQSIKEIIGIILIPIFLFLALPLFHHYIAERFFPENPILTFLFLFMGISAIGTLFIKGKKIKEPIKTKEKKEKIMWKEFFKIDRKKDIVFIIILFVQGILLLIYCFNDIMKQDSVPGLPGYAISNKCKLVSNYLFWPSNIITIKFSFFGAVLGMIIGMIIIPYLLSCLIVWIYDKVKKKS